MKAVAAYDEASRSLGSILEGYSHRVLGLFQRYQLMAPLKLDTSTLGGLHEGFVEYCAPDPVKSERRIGVRYPVRQNALISWNHRVHSCPFEFGLLKVIQQARDL